MDQLRISDMYSIETEKGIQNLEESTTSRADILTLANWAHWPWKRGRESGWLAGWMLLKLRWLGESGRENTDPPGHCCRAPMFGTQPLTGQTSDPSSLAPSLTHTSREIGHCRACFRVPILES